MKEKLITHEAASDAKKIDLDNKLNIQKFTTQRERFTAILFLVHKNQASPYIKDPLV